MGDAHTVEGERVEARTGEKSVGMGRVRYLRRCEALVRIVLQEALREIDRLRGRLGREHAFPWVCLELG